MDWEIAYVISGGNDFLSHRCVKKLRSLAIKEGRTVREVRGEDSNDLQDALESVAFFDEESALETVVIVSNADSIRNFDIVKAHIKAGGEMITLVLHFQKSISVKAKKALEVLGKKCYLQFDFPKPWEAVEFAEKFCVQEVKQQGLTTTLMDVSLIVYVVGTSNFGALTFEVLKGCMYAKSQGDSHVTSQHFVKSISTSYQHDAFPVLKSLGVKDSVSVARKLGAIKRTTKGDPTMGICGLLGSQLTTWISVVQLSEQGYSFDDIATRIVMNNFRLKKEFEPIVEKWRLKDLIDLFQGVASVERCVKSGKANPWVTLNALLLQSCKT